MEHVSAHKGGMESTAHSKDALGGKKNDNFLMRTWAILLSILFRCSNQGQCRVGLEGLFECRCFDGFDGADCSLVLEKDCKDGKDNDKGKFHFILESFFFNINLNRWSYWLWGSRMLFTSVMRDKSAVRFKPQANWYSLT